MGQFLGLDQLWLILMFLTLDAGFLLEFDGKSYLLGRMPVSLACFLDKEIHYQLSTTGVFLSGITLLSYCHWAFSDHSTCFTAYLLENCRDWGWREGVLLSSSKEQD